MINALGHGICTRTRTHRIMGIHFDNRIIIILLHVGAGRDGDKSILSFLCAKLGGWQKMCSGPGARAIIIYIFAGCVM